MDWFQQVLRKCSQIVPQKIELSGTGQGMATLAAWPASTPWALGHDSAKVVFQRCFFKRLDVFSWLLWIEMRKNYAARLKNLWKLQLSGELLWKLSSGSCFAVEQLCRYSDVSRSTFWNFWIPEEKSSTPGLMRCEPVGILTWRIEIWNQKETKQCSKREEKQWCQSKLR